MCELEAVGCDDGDEESIDDSFLEEGVDEVNVCHCEECF